MNNDFLKERFAEAVRLLMTGTDSQRELAKIVVAQNRDEIRNLIKLV